MCIATSFIAACSHLKIAPQAAEHTLRTGTRSPYAGTQTATHHGERLRCCQALQLTRSHPSGAARLYELSATSPFCCRVSFGSHIFRHVCPWHRAVPARFIANDRYLVKLFEPGGRPFLPSLFILWVIPSDKIICWKSSVHGDGGFRSRAVCAARNGRNAVADQRSRDGQSPWVRLRGDGECGCCTRHAGS